MGAICMQSGYPGAPPLQVVQAAAGDCLAAIELLVQNLKVCWRRKGMILLVKGRSQTSMWGMSRPTWCKHLPSSSLGRGRCGHQSSLHARCSETSICKVQRQEVSTVRGHIGCPSGGHVGLQKLAPGCIPVEGKHIAAAPHQTCITPMHAACRKGSVRLQLDNRVRPAWYSTQAACLRAMTNGHICRMKLAIECMLLANCLQAS